MLRNDVRTVTLPVLVSDEGFPQSARVPDGWGWGTFFPADHAGCMAVRAVSGREIKARLRTIFRPDELPLFVGVMELKGAYDAGDELALQRASEKVRPWLADFASPRERQWKTADGRVSIETVGRKWNATRWNYSRLTADMFRNARLVIYFPENEEGRPLPALYCPDWKTAAFVMTFLGRIRVCPKCSIIFIPAADNVTYCTPAHREAHRVARSRWRAQQRAGKRKTQKAAR